MQPPQPAAPRLQPMQIGDIFDRAFRLYRQDFSTFVSIVAIPQVPIIVLQVIVATFLFGSQTMIATFGLSRQVAFGAMAVIVLIQAIVVQPLIAGALIRTISRAYLNQPISLREAYRLDRRRIGNLLAAGIFVSSSAAPLALLLSGPSWLLSLMPLMPGVASFVLSIALAGIYVVALPALFLSMFLIFVYQAITIEEQNVWQAIGRSLRLVFGVHAHVVGTLLVLCILLVVLTSVPPMIFYQMLVWFTDLTSGSAAYQSLTTLVSSSVNILTLPLQVAVVTLLHYDVRVRTEGYDLELRVQEVGHAAAPPNPTVSGEQ